MTDELTRRFVELGLYQGQELLLLDLEKCTRCDECVRACADSHEGVTRVVRDGPRFGHFLVAVSCRSCHDPYCLTGCPVDAIHRQGHTLEIQIDDHCIGCGLCAHNCPYGSIHMVEHGADGSIRDIPPADWPTKDQAVDTARTRLEATANQTSYGQSALQTSFQTSLQTGIFNVDEDEAQPKRKAKLMAVNCDLCRGSLSGPRCVYACPHDAAHRVTGDRALELAQKRQVPLREDGILANLWRLLRGNPRGE